MMSTRAFERSEEPRILGSRMDFLSMEPSLDPAGAYDPETERLETHVDVSRRVGEQHHVAHAEIAQNLRADPDLDLPSSAPVLGGGLRRGAARNPVGDALRPEISNEDDDAAPFPFDRGERSRDDRFPG